MEEKNFEGYFECARGEYDCEYIVTYTKVYIDDSFDAHNKAGDLVTFNAGGYEAEIERIDIYVQYEEGHEVEILDYKLKPNDPNANFIFDQINEG